VQMPPVSMTSDMAEGIADVQVAPACKLGGHHVGFSLWPIALSRTQAPNDAGLLYAISSLSRSITRTVAQLNQRRN
jgi:hypothetical protein